MLHCASLEAITWRRYTENNHSRAAPTGSLQQSQTGSTASIKIGLDCFEFDKYKIVQSHLVLYEKTFSTIRFSQKRKKKQQYLLRLWVKPDFDPNGKLGAFTNSTSSFSCRCCFTTCFWAFCPKGYVKQTKEFWETGWTWPQQLWAASAIYFLFCFLYLLSVFAPSFLDWQWSFVLFFPPPAASLLK